MKKMLTAVALLLNTCVMAQPAAAYSIVIDEIMADPTPPVGLPNAEFVELKNVSGAALNLNGWRLGDASGFASININFILQPDSLVIICASSAATLFAAFGTTIGVSNFPSLNNDGDQLYLRSREGRTIHAVSYTTAWYQNTVKQQGGWTLEMIDVHNACSGAANWTASNNYKGGTPGKKNSVDGLNKDLQPPVLRFGVAADSTSITLSFDEPLDSVSAAPALNYKVSDGIGTPLSVIAIAPAFNKVQLTFNKLLASNKIYTVTVSNVTDCAGNIIGAYNTVMAGRSVIATTADLVINEVLFNPKPDGADYVELYNRSADIIDLKDCYIANRSAGIIGSLKQLSTDNRLVFPGSYIVITEDAAAVARQYLVKDPEAVTTISAMPSYPDDMGDIVILNGQGKIIDELNYDAHWQFKLNNTDEGVALERIDYNKPTQDAANWHSAATGAGYGTPGYRNSQFIATGMAGRGITMTPEVFSPDNDGFEDFLTIQYQFTEPGYVCSITIFDAGGRPVRYLTRNALCGLQGYFRWDGLNDKYTKLPIGVYIVFTEVFNLQGKSSRLKQAVTLARKLG